MNDLAVFINRYRQSLELANFALVTIRGYMRMLGKFSEFLEEQGITDIQAIQTEHIQAYQRELLYSLNRQWKPNQPTNLNNHLKAIKGLFKFMTRQGYLSQNPANAIDYAKTPQRLPRTVLEENEVVKLVSQPDITNPTGYRDRTILEVLYSTAIRRNELLCLKPGDIDWEKGFIRINQGKGGKDRVVPVGKIASRFLENYVKLVRVDLQRLTNNEYLFLSKYGKRLSEAALKELIYKHAKAAGIERRISPHVFRHTCATHLVKNKANIRCVQEMLGHKSLDTTQLYTRITITDLKEAHKRCHPREKNR